MVIKSTCADCTRKNVCAYVVENFDIVNTDNPFIRISCKEYYSTAKRTLSKNWSNPKSKETVQEWRKANPYGRRVDCHRETGLSRPTINKYWDAEEAESEE